MPKEKIPTRLQIPALGEFYDDLLELDAWIRGNSKPAQASSLLCAKLQEREERIERRLAYLAKKRGIDKEEMRALILRGEAEKLAPEEIPLPSDLIDDLDE